MIGRGWTWRVRTMPRIRPFAEKDDVIATEGEHARGWFEHQLDVTTDINTWPWFRWYYGGLDWHTVHHTFPLMSRAQWVKSFFLPVRCDSSFDEPLVCIGPRFRRVHGCTVHHWS
jgi:hypothetical protein